MLRPPRISNHALKQYQARAILCCERKRSDEVLRRVISDQIAVLPCRQTDGGESVVECGFTVPHPEKPGLLKRKSVSYTFVVEGQKVVTVLGYLMRPNPKMIKRRAKRLITNGQ